MATKENVTAKKAVKAAAALAAGKVAIATSNGEARPASARTKADGSLEMANKARMPKAAKAPKAAADNSILAIHVNRTGRYLFVLNPGRSARRFLRR